jgi:hypothetical protein
MSENRSRVPKPVTGFVGFGCGFLLSTLVLFFSVLPTTGVGLLAVIAIAALLGLLTARLGEPFFEKLVALFSWF